jgi:hypothetical protein
MHISSLQFQVSFFLLLSTITYSPIQIKLPFASSSPPVTSLCCDHCGVTRGHITRQRLKGAWREKFGFPHESESRCCPSRRRRKRKRRAGGCLLAADHANDAHVSQLWDFFATLPFHSPEVQSKILILGLHLTTLVRAVPFLHNTWLTELELSLRVGSHKSLLPQSEGRKGRRKAVGRACGTPSYSFYSSQSFLRRRDERPCEFY